MLFSEKKKWGGQGQAGIHKCKVETTGILHHLQASNFANANDLQEKPAHYHEGRQNPGPRSQSRRPGGGEEHGLPHTNQVSQCTCDSVREVQLLLTLHQPFNINAAASLMPSQPHAQFSGSEL